MGGFSFVDVPSADHVTLLFSSIRLFHIGRILKEQR